MERIRSERTVARRIFSRACTALDQELKKEEVDYESACAKMRTVQYEAQKLFELDEEMKVKLFAEEIDEEDQVKEFEDMSDYRNLFDRLSTQLRALESLGVTKEKYAAMLFPMVESTSGHLEGLGQVSAHTNSCGHRISEDSGLDADEPHGLPQGRGRKRRKNQARFRWVLLRKSYVASSIAKELKLKNIRKEAITHCLFGGVTSKPEEHSLYEVELASLKGDKSIKIQVLDQSIRNSILPLQPGGIVWMIKELVMRNLGQAALTYEELTTVICDIEAVINARPLTYVAEEAEELQPISPKLFIQDIKSTKTDFDTLLSGDHGIGWDQHAESSTVQPFAW
ncbi:hypothetical protein GE061_000835 [Apolygus lucorum]|uniref:Uncharacterized protein n=1 Tax=Apolygus lucorum TaxID=248454 RepID=A0A8S9Y5N9_APOLU|nr:hypothetical protein GE061_000835 [Apolygus lucorum]